VFDVVIFMLFQLLCYVFDDVFQIIHKAKRPKTLNTYVCIQT